MGPKEDSGLAGSESEPHRATEGGRIRASLCYGSLAGLHRGEDEKESAGVSAALQRLVLLVMGSEAVLAQHLVL